MSAIPLRRNRDFILLWSGQVVSTLGSEVSGLAFPLLVLSLTGSPAQAGIVGFARGLPYLLVYLPAGALVDRWNRKHVMLAADAGRALAIGSVAATRRRPAYTRSFSRSSRLTTFGSALPCVSFSTWPTRKPSTPSLPPRYVAT